MIFIKYDLNDFGSDMTILGRAAVTSPHQSPRVIHIAHDQLVTVELPDNHGLNLMIEHQLDRQELVLLVVNNSHALVGRVSIYKERDPTHWGQALKATLEHELSWRDDLEHSKLLIWEPREQEPGEFTTKFLEPWTQEWNLHPTREVYHLEADKIMLAIEFNKHKIPVKPFLKITRTLDSWTKCGVESQTLWRSNYASHL